MEYLQLERELSETVTILKKKSLFKCVFLNLQYLARLFNSQDDPFF